MNLKKIAASIAALGAVTFAHAANVEFYGSIDNSVSYIKAKGQNGQASMYASNDSSPKLGLTGKEDIGNGHFVRFKEALQKTPCQAGWNKNVLFGFS